MVSYYAWNILLCFVISFGFVSAVFMIGKYAELENTCRKLNNQKIVLERKLNEYTQTK